MANGRLYAGAERERLLRVLVKCLRILLGDGLVQKQVLAPEAIARMPPTNFTGTSP